MTTEQVVSAVLCTRYGQPNEPVQSPSENDIKAGMAWWYRQYAKEQTQQERIDYEQAESQAKRHRYGLWSGPSPTPPWEWRQR